MEGSTRQMQVSVPTSTSQMEGSTRQMQVSVPTSTSQMEESTRQMQVNDPPHLPNGGEYPSNAGECPHPLKMCYQALKNKTNSPLKQFKWVKDDE